MFQYPLLDRSVIRDSAKIINIPSAVFQYPLLDRSVIRSAEAVTRILATAFQYPLLDRSVIRDGDRSEHRLDRHVSVSTTGSFGNPVNSQ